MLRNIVFLPHGMQIIPGVEKEPLEKFMTINNHMEELMEQYASRNMTNNVVMLTPHGYNLAEKLVVYNHEKFKGTIFSLSQESNIYGEALFSFEYNGNSKQTEEIIEKLPQISIETLSHGYPGYPLTLNWGEMVPLYYYHKYNPKSTYSMMCYPRTRHTDFDKIQLLNDQLVSMINDLDHDFNLLISGDLSHVHQESGPYGYHESCSIFDNLIQEWAKSPEEKTMNEILSMQPVALACGMAGLNLIHKLLSQGQYKLITSFYEVPTYFGMGGYWWQQVDE